jgi:hypothetical protein
MNKINKIFRLLEQEEDLYSDDEQPSYVPPQVPVNALPFDQQQQMMQQQLLQRQGSQAQNDPMATGNDIGYPQNQGPIQGQDPYGAPPDTATGGYPQDQGQDQYGGPIGGWDATQDPNAIPTTQLARLEPGQVVTLKKIYSRLGSVSNILDSMNHEDFSTVKKQVGEAIDTFETIIQAIDQFRDKMPEIIKTYGVFLQGVSKEIEEILNKIEGEEDVDSK